MLPMGMPPPGMPPMGMPPMGMLPLANMGPPGTYFEAKLRRKRTESNIVVLVIRWNVTPPNLVFLEFRPELTVSNVSG